MTVSRDGRGGRVGSISGQVELRVVKRSLGRTHRSVLLLKVAGPE